MSRYIIGAKSEYYQRLLDVTRTRAWEPWVLYILRGVEQTARWTLEKIAAIRNLVDHTEEFVRARLPKIYSLDLVNSIFEQPYSRIGTLVDAGVAQRQTAARYLKELVALGVLNELREGREKLFIHPKFLRLLTTDDNDFDRYA